MPSDRLDAISVAALRGIVSGGPQRYQKKTQMRWAPTRWQSADGLAKPGLEITLQARHSAATTLLHEVSAAAEKKSKPTCDLSCWPRRSKQARWTRVSVPECACVAVCMFALGVSLRRRCTAAVIAEASIEGARRHGTEMSCGPPGRYARAHHRLRASRPRRGPGIPRTPIAVPGYPRTCGPQWSR